MRTSHSLLVSAVAVKWRLPSPSSFSSWCQSCFVNTDKSLLVFVSFTLYIGKTIIERDCGGRSHYPRTIVVTQLLGLLRIPITCALLSKMIFFSLLCTALRVEYFTIFCHITHGYLYFFNSWGLLLLAFVPCLKAFLALFSSSCINCNLGTYQSLLDSQEFFFSSFLLVWS